MANFLASMIMKKISQRFTGALADTGAKTTLKADAAFLEKDIKARKRDRREEECREGVAAAAGASPFDPRVTRGNRGRPIDTIATALAQVRARQEESLTAASADEDATAASDDVVPSPVSADEGGGGGEGPSESDSTTEGVEEGRARGGERPSENDSTTEGGEEGRAEGRTGREPPTGGRSSVVEGAEGEAPSPSAPPRGEAATRGSGGPRRADVEVATGDETDGSIKENEDRGEASNVDIRAPAVKVATGDGTEAEAPSPSAPSRGEAATRSSGGVGIHAPAVKVATGDGSEAPSLPSSKSDASDKENEDGGKTSNIDVHNLALRSAPEDPHGNSDSEESDDGYREFLRAINESR